MWYYKSITKEKAINYLRDPLPYERGKPQALADKQFSFRDGIYTIR